MIKLNNYVFYNNEDGAENAKWKKCEHNIPVIHEIAFIKIQISKLIQK